MIQKVGKRGILQFSKIEKLPPQERISIKQMLNRSRIPITSEIPITGFPCQLFFQRENVSHHPSLLPPLFFPPHYHLVSQDADSVADQFQLHFITEILLLQRRKLKVKHNLVFPAMLAQAPERASSDHLTI